ncbi:MAG: serine hydrolase domain-containing protein [Flavobacteriaceae bacterium]
MKIRLFILFLFTITITYLSAQSVENSDRILLTANTPSVTAEGNAFIAPADWYLSQNGHATFIEAPEGGSRIVLIDVDAEADTLALDKGWAAYKEPVWTVREVNTAPDKDGWSRKKSFNYETSPEEKRWVSAGVRYANEKWTVWIYDMETAVGEKRGAQVSLIFSSLLPKGYSKESFTGKTANLLDESKIGELSSFIETAIEKTKVPGVGLGIIQNDSVVFAGGFGVSTLGKTDKVDAETLFLVASNTKAMTTLLLAKLVEEGKINWNTPVTDVMSDFKLGSEETTKRTLVEHLICACTGLPRKDMELIFEFGGITPSVLMERLAVTEPTSDFGELFQYSNSLAAAAGFVAGHVLYPDKELGEAYDLAMKNYVFDPLGMTNTTFDFGRALAMDYADAHGTTIDGESASVGMDFNLAIVHARPAGGAWSTVNDMLKYIDMEISEGKLPDGEQYIDKEILLERRVGKVPISEQSVYGMGLMIDNTYGVEVVHHGGDLMGHHSDMIWLPEYGVGAVVLTNGDPGWMIRGQFQRKLLEVLFDGNPEAEDAVAAGSVNYYNSIATSRELYTVPAAKEYVDQLSATYVSEDLGRIEVHQKDGAVFFDFGEWNSEMGTQKNPDGTISFVTVSPGIVGLPFVLHEGDTPKLIMRDAQHEYVFIGQ